jgi:hypothetical protein
MELELPLRVVVVAPPVDCDFGVQKGRGAQYEVLSKQRSTGADLHFDLTLRVRPNATNGAPNFLGPFAQGTPQARFFYLDIGEYAGQKHTHWARRAKIPLHSIDWELIEKVRRHPGSRLEARYAGTDRRGGPTCATVKLLDGGWKLSTE